MSAEHSLSSYLAMLDATRMQAFALPAHALASHSQAALQAGNVRTAPLQRLAE